MGVGWLWQVYGKGNKPRILAFDCGMKFNIVRYFVQHQKAEITVVPWNYDLKVRPATHFRHRRGRHT